MSLSLSMKSTGALLLVLIAISYTAVDAFRWRFPFRRRCEYRTVNAVCRVAADPGTVNPFCGFRCSGLTIKLELQGFSTDDTVVLHGFHAHELGDLSNGCTSLGGHYNPFGRNHGDRTSTERHVGDFGNIQEAADGSVNTTIIDNVARLFGPNSLIGRSLVIHAGTDDLGRGGNAGSVASGNSGPRVGCCVIGRAASPPPVRLWG
ncbi:superoxide dismutase [Cu-Zn]-like [Haliotis rubra]|uniref:superoxide dismutase [Cu-Zn]-like n=1 Tax=Haliotis rubra TaxID=36100 RepID=UPI001EE52545|nr:superoxide dismutase [Cu-Zn]-like [Haliotis rubra]